MVTRRVLLKRLAGLPLVGSLFGLETFAGSPPPSYARRDYFKEVIDAFNYATNEYVLLDDLQDKVGERIAELLHCEAATISAGAFSAMTLGLAGVLSGMDQQKVEQIPDLTGMKDEVLMQKSHRVGYDHALRNCGVKIVLAETRKELEKAINEKTAMMWFLNAHNFDGEIRDEEFVEIAHKHGIPSFNDCAADVPPVENLWKYTDMGFDLVCFSGGKGLRGPQSAGLLLGKKKYIDAARLHAPPRGNTVGRGMKVNKEEILGMLATVEAYLANDHEKEWTLWENQIKTIHAAAASVPGVMAEIHVPEVANHVPSLKISMDGDKMKMTPDELRQKLREGHPSIETVGGKESVGITTWMMQPGQERIVASRIKEILEAG
jgi:uncharacterized pyridoxal phosphate-dependent enzyme